jgi:FkbM family methyltransferase
VPYTHPMRKPARSLLSSPSTATGDMPYNWNWQRRWTEAADFLRQHRIVLMDVGARGDAPPELESMAEHVLWVGFEADPEECARLNATGAGRFFPNLVAGEEGPLTLNLYENAAQSSVLTVNERFARLWLGDMPLDRTFTSDAITLDSFLAEHEDLRPDMLKIDTQGTELDILHGTEKSLESIGLVEVEVEFLEHYDGQPLFGDVSRFMLDHGYELLYLSRVFASRTQLYTGPSRGQLLYGDALFGKREDAVAALDTVQLTKYCILLCQFGHIDVAWQIMQDHPEVARAAPGLRSVFRKRSNRVSRGVLMQVDKLLALGLHARRYNQRGMDTDRAWPLR